MKFARSKKSTEELADFDMTVPDFKDVEVIPHDDYLNGIQNKDAVLICMNIPTKEFPDNLQGECAKCGCNIYYRHYNEKANKKICVTCAKKLLGEKNDI